jgi:FtsP/CotA-like multicopper oxidase with cupredoxin domain
MHVMACAMLAVGFCSPLLAVNDPGTVYASKNRWINEIAPRVAKDLNPDPDVVEVELRAAPRMISLGEGMPPTELYAYNNGLPGPTIEAKVGDTLIVHFYNDLPEQTTIHWHGVDTPATMDGSHISQLAVEPGEYFRYEFTLLKASLFWYHPHIRTNVQVENGLYGALIVRDPEGEAGLDLPGAEHILLLDDILLDRDYQVAEFVPADPLERAEGLLNGRSGNVMLVNGTAGAAGQMKGGDPQRLRVVNVSNTRFMRISLPGYRMFRIGGDGGLLEAPIEIQPIGPAPDLDRSRGLILTPGERADLVFTPRHGEDFELEWHDIDRGRHEVSYAPSGAIMISDAPDDGLRPTRTLMNIRSRGKPNSEEYLPPGHLRNIPMIDVSGLTSADKFRYLFGHGPANPATGNVMFFIQTHNGMPPPMGGIPLPFPVVTPADAVDVTVGDTKIWEVVNMSGGDHNFHTHGFQFQLLEVEYRDMDDPGNNRVEPAAYLEDKDTHIIPKRPGAFGRSQTISRFAVHFDDTGREGQAEAFGKIPTETTSGGWLVHCHILEHSAGGMMSFFEVFNP